MKEKDAQQFRDCEIPLKDKTVSAIGVTGSGMVTEQKAHLPAVQ